jgi:hypothetical protein
MLNPNNLLLYLASDENALARLLAFRTDLVLLLSPGPLSSGGAAPARRLLLSSSIAEKGEDGDDDDKEFAEALDVGSLRASIA